jgi:hypothetical protein
MADKQGGEPLVLPVMPYCSCANFSDGAWDCDGCRAVGGNFGARIDGGVYVPNWCERYGPSSSEVSLAVAVRTDIEFSQDSERVLCAKHNFLSLIEGSD